MGLSGSSDGAYRAQPRATGVLIPAEGYMRREVGGAGNAPPFSNVGRRRETDNLLLFLFLFLLFLLRRLSSFPHYFRHVFSPSFVLLWYAAPLVCRIARSLTAVPSPIVFLIRPIQGEFIRVFHDPLALILVLLLAPRVFFFRTIHIAFRSLFICLTFVIYLFCFTFKIFFLGVFLDAFGILVDCRDSFLDALSFFLVGVHRTSDAIPAPIESTSRPNKTTRTIIAASIAGAVVLILAAALIAFLALRRRRRAQKPTVIHLWAPDEEEKTLDLSARSWTEDRNKAAGAEWTPPPTPGFPGVAFPGAPAAAAADPSPSGPRPSTSRASIVSAARSARTTGPAARGSTASLKTPHYTTRHLSLTAGTHGFGQDLAWRDAHYEEVLPVPDAFAVPEVLPVPVPMPKPATVVAAASAELPVVGVVVPPTPGRVPHQDMPHHPTAFQGSMASSVSSRYSTVSMPDSGAGRRL
ncbi:unnamed protein product [Mycena citricolor]|uniref:Transmembrane protein n=1 Tax=Mycena citricolor TaxID=2018698 RepID=A0AAD2H271_9AGAR|nr:unnamed protein product [Mycena citricolor]